MNTNKHYTPSPTSGMATVAVMLFTAAMTLGVAYFVSVTFIG